MDVIRVLLSWAFQAIKIGVPVVAAAAILLWLRYALDVHYHLVLGVAFGAAAIWLVVRWFNRPGTPPDAS